jgi:hypothetical protein
MGYHIRDIRKGELGESSKIQEELDELMDAEDQGNKVLMLCELADIYGAMDLYLHRYFESLTMYDIAVMAKATKQAFEDGERE